MSILKSLEKQRQMLQTKENPEPTTSSSKSQLSGKICRGKFTCIFTPLVETFYVAPLRNHPNITVFQKIQLLLLLLFYDYHSNSISVVSQLETIPDIQKESLLGMVDYLAVT